MSATVTEAAAAARQFVTFEVRQELFGVPLSEVQEIIRMPAVVQVPLSPPGLEGIANLRGAVLPVTSLRRVFGMADAAHDDATRVVVVQRAGTPQGFVVDRMASVIAAEPQEIEEAGALETTVRCSLLRGVVKRDGGMIMLLDPASLGGMEAATRRAATHHAAGTAATRTEAAVATAAEEIQLVSFEAAGQEYAFPIGTVQEIVQVPERITAVPRAQPHVVGVMTLREKLLPLVSLRRMFGLPEATADENTRIVVIAPQGAGSAVGLVMDRVKEVLRVSRALVEPVPALLAGADGRGEIEAICRLQGGKRLVSILSATRMFHDDALRGALAAATEGAEAEAMATTTEALEEEEQFVVFRLDGEEYGVPIAAVQEIVRVPEELTRVPKAASFMEGVVNLRGTVLPVVDQRRRFALAEAERNDRQRIMVLMIGGLRTGFIVDSVTEVVRLPRAAIGPAPTLSEEQARLIRRVANLPAQKRMVLLLEPANLLEAGELQELAAM